MSEAYRSGEAIPDAHLRGSETEWERRVRDAAEGKPDGPPKSEAPVRGKVGRPKGGAGKKAATAWQARNRELRQRRSKRIEQPGEAIAIWARLRDAGEAKSGGRPKGLWRPTAAVGDSVERQIHDKVQLDYDLLRPDERLSDAIARWLPCTFYDPAPPLCDAEIQELLREAADEDRRAEEEKAQERGRLLPGMCHG